MSLPLLTTALLALLKSEVAVGIVSGAAGQALFDVAKSPVARLAQQWQKARLGNNDLGRALERAYRKALGAIALGLADAPGAWGVLTSEVSREFAADFQARFLAPFAAETGLDEAARQKLRRDGRWCCHRLSEAAGRVLDLGDLSPYETVDRLLYAGGGLDPAQAGAIAELSARAGRELLDRVRAEGIPGRFCDLLAYTPPDAAGQRQAPLLLGAIVYFFQEELKADERVARTLTHKTLQEVRVEQARQQELLNRQLQEIRQDIIRLQEQGAAAIGRGDFAAAQALVNQGQELSKQQAVHQAGLQEAADQLARIPQAEAVLAAIDAGMARYAEMLGEIKTLITTRFDELEGWLHQEFGFVERALRRIEDTLNAIQRSLKVYTRLVLIIVVVEFLVWLAYQYLNSWVKVPVWALVVFLVLLPVLIYLWRTADEQV
jgi:tetratricopeptide (TPR) repeat protein